MRYQLADLLDIPRLQSALDSLYISSRIPSAIVDNNGVVHTGSGWQDVCTKFHRVHPEARKRCIESDLYISRHIGEANPSIIYKCLHGLVDSATPIVIEGEHIGNVFTGQLFLEEPELDSFRAQARTYGFDEEEYIDAVKKVPVVSEQALKENLAFIAHLTGMLAEMGLKRTREKEAERRLRESEGRRRSLFCRASDGIFIMSTDGKLIEVNESFARMHGYTTEELLQMSIKDLDTPESFKMAPERIRRLVGGETLIFEVEHYHKDGHVFPLEVSASLISSGGESYIQCFHRDITEQKRAEDVLRESEKKFRGIFDTASDGIVIAKVSTRKLVEVNRAICEMLGYTREELLRLGRKDLHPAPDLPQDIAEFNKQGQAGKRISDSLPVKRKDGSVFYADISATLVEIEGEQHHIGIFRDATERKLAEEQNLRSKEELRMLACHLQENIEKERRRIAREIHDELGQQLTALKNDLLWTESHLPKGSKHLAGEIRSMSQLVDLTTRSVHEIIHELRPPLLDDLGLPEAIDWQISEFRDRTGIACELDAVLDDFDLGPDSVTGVFRLLQEMLANVAQHSGAKRCKVRIRRRTDGVSLSVRDDGTGIPVDRIVDSGSFGLLGMRERVRALGGRFRIHGVPGKGTIVAVTIPVRAAGSSLESWGGP